MKVLLLFPMSDKQTGSAIQRAFENLGHKAIAVDAKLEPGNSHAVSLAFNPDLIFCSRTKMLTNQVLQIKKSLPNAITCLWNVDARANIESWKHLYPLIKLVDYHFVVDTTTIPQWKELNPNTFFLPQGLQNERYKKPDYITRKDIEKYTCDVSFAGRNRPYRHPFIHAVNSMDIDFKKWGCLKMPKVYNEEHNKMVSLSKINLGCSANPELDNCISVRDYKILGARGFLLEAYRNTERLFPHGIMDYYDTAKDMVSKIYYWLNHDEERKAIAEKGYKWVHESATYTHRIQEALDIMKDKLC